MSRPLSILTAAVCIATLAGTLYCGARLRSLEDRFAEIERPAPRRAPLAEPTSEERELARLRAEVEQLRARPLLPAAQPLDADDVERAVAAAMERESKRKVEHLEEMAVAATLESVLPRLTAALHLSADQIPTVGELLRRATVDEVRLWREADTGEKVAEAEGKRDQIRAKRDADVRALLTVEQRDSYEQFVKREGLEPVLRKRE
ncbi:MAG: hypothetical protein HYY18_08210 [Planctomycetes bacterium]|nr:hypothetical protein [Planctomycetota bacterium]